MAKKKVLILGCGWVGSITATTLLKAGHAVWGSTTQDSKLQKLEEIGIQPLLLDFSQEVNGKGLLPFFEQQSVDLVIISVPVRRNEDPETCLAKFTHLIEFVSRIPYKQVVYLSSIGIYVPINGEITESSAVKQGSTLVKIEELLSKKLNDLLLLRLGGLFGFNRIPGRYFSQKTTNLGQEKANYVHATDVALVLSNLLKKQIPSGKYNLVAPIHPLKKDIYDAMAQKYKFPAVLYEEEKCIQKEISSQKLMDHLQFQFTVPSPLDF